MAERKDDEQVKKDSEEASKQYDEDGSFGANRWFS